MSSTRDISVAVAGAVLSAVVITALGAGWDRATNGDLVRLLGGVPRPEFDGVVKQLTSARSELDAVAKKLTDAPKLPEPVPPSGPLSGHYIVKSWTLAEEPPNRLLELTYRVDLKAEGNDVSGTISSMRENKLRYFFKGYVNRDRFMSFAYGGPGGGLGTGAYTLEESADNILWGHATKVECVNGDAFYARCPAVMYREGYDELAKAKRYEDFIKGECEKVTMAPKSCGEAK